MSRSWMAVVAVAVAVLLAASGCVPAIEVGGPGAPAADYNNGPYGQDCDDPLPDLDGPATEPVPADAVLVTATRCIFELERVPGDGEWSVRIEQEATTGLDELATALRTPSEARGPGQACPAIAYAPIVMTVTDTAGRQFHPTIPTTACGAPLKVAADAIDALPWTTVRRTRVARITSELEISSGCPGEYKAMVALVAAEGDAGAARLPVDTTPRPLRVCRFAVPPEAATSAARGELYVGELADVSTLDAAGAQELLTAIDSAPDPTAPCTELSAFVLIDEADGGRLELVIEVDGCYRAMVGSDVRQLDPDLVQRVLG